MAAKSVAGDFAMKTGADHARNYRQRQREKIARYEGALREIVALKYADHDLMRDIAHNALCGMPALHIEV